MHDRLTKKKLKKRNATISLFISFNETHPKIIYINRYLLEDKIVVKSHVMNVTSIPFNSNFIVCSDCP